MIDENEFFRNATLIICGNLEIETAMAACLRYLNRFLPVDRMFLQVNEPNLGAIRTIATANAEGGREVDLLTALGKVSRERIQRHAAAQPEEIVVIDTADKNPVVTDMVRYHGLPDSSILRMQLVTESGHIGAIVLTAEGAGRYTEVHIRLLRLLKDPFTITLANTLKHREVILLRDRLADDNRYLNRELQRLSGDEIVGADFGLRNVMKQVRQVAPTESVVLLTGETGVGKDVIARTIHQGSLRREGPFIAVNCGAIPEALLGSELFGHEKGAFTGALSKKRGRFERADKGTILLDEIGEMPLEAQVHLLRVLEHREIERVGGTRRIPVDIRIIAATHQDLPMLVRSGRFREDLYYRLNVFPIVVPPVRQRIDDIPALVRYFIERKSQELKLPEINELAAGAIETLMAYNWPGNVRELENVIERALILHRGAPLRFDDLGLLPVEPVKTSAGVPEDDTLELDALVKRHIKRVLTLTEGKIHGPGGAGEILGVNPDTLRSKMKKLGIPFRKKKKKA